MADEPVVESFAAWLLATQLAAVAGMGAGTSQPTPPAAASVEMQADYRVVKQALDLLNLYQVIPNPYNLDIRLVQRATATPTTKRPAALQAAAFTVGNVQRIYIVTGSDTFQRAARGDKQELINLAGYIAHEYHHLKHGKDEASAYDFQIKALEKMGASTTLIRAVKRAKTAVVGR